MLLVRCGYCNKEFWVKVSRIKRLRKAEICCSKLCADKYRLVHGGWNKGRPWSEEVKRKISLARVGSHQSHKGRPLTLEHRQKISVAHRGIIFSESHRKHIAESHKGNIHSAETKQKMSEFHKQWASKHPEFWENLSQEMKNGKAEAMRACVSPLQELKRREHISVWNRTFGQEKTYRMINRQQELFRTDAEYRDRVVKARLRGNHLKPNKLETLFLNMLNEWFPDCWEFTGDGSLIIGGFNPDFRNLHKNCIIEIFGDFWHDKDEVEYKKNVYSSFGFRCLIFWEREVRGLPKEILKGRILESVA